MSWHECDECGQACYCDGDDTLLPVDEEEGCVHACQDLEDEDGALPCPVCDDGIQEKCPHCGREP